MSDKRDVNPAVNDLELIKQQLMEKKAEIEQEMVLLNEEKFSDDQVQDVADQALTSTMESLKSSFQNSKIDEYKRVIKALDMIKEGVYGICADCEQVISPKRLQSFPNATRCIVCQELFEETGDQYE
ncbi:MAG TPA: TraR/DksA family transcriptional regulator [Candidatus Babeliales bacterium]|nr:TraR/DksA family transcriptional regulator [Candidatus Babeliales bacterium]